MTDRLPPNLLRLFAPRPPIPYLPPLDKEPDEHTGPYISGIAHLVPLLNHHDLEYEPWDDFEAKKLKKIEEREKKHKLEIEKALAEWRPHDDKKVTSDPFKTLFVGRLSYNITEKALKKEFEYFGPIKEIVIVKHRLSGAPRGYAFVEFDREKDMKQAYKEMDGVKLDHRRIVVDVERGRTVKGWKPRRLGGGLGYTRLGPKEICQHYSGRDTRQRPSSSPPRSSESSHRRRRRSPPYEDDSYSSRKRYRSRSPRYSGSSSSSSSSSRDHRRY